MPCLSRKFQPSDGLIMDLGFAPPAAGGALPPPSQVKMFAGLIDTGASCTCISAAVALALGLAPISQGQMVSATHTAQVNIYLVDIVLPFGPSVFIQPSLPVMEFAATGNEPYQVLIGRDIICQGALALSFDGHFTFSR